MLESLVESMVDGIMAVRPDRGVLLYNHAARRLLGEQFPRDRFPGAWQTLITCVHDDGSMG